MSVDSFLLLFAGGIVIPFMAPSMVANVGLTEAQLDTPYRPEGWTPRQIVHHLADSHMNAFIRFKLALTEETPPIKTYEESLWAELSDARTLPVETSLIAGAQNVGGSSGRPVSVITAP